MNVALILAGGTGTRTGLNIPKQYIEVNGQPLISWCMERVDCCDEISYVQIVADEAWHELIRKQSCRKFKGFSKPGANRQLSIVNGLEDIRQYASEDDLVMIHDAARPNISSELIHNCFHEAQQHDGALPVLSMKDTVYLSEDGKTVSSLLDRNHIFAGQAPEVFRLGLYYEANKRLLPTEIMRINGSTEPAILAGMDIALISGEESNFKITTMADLERFRQMAERRNE